MSKYVCKSNVLNFELLVLFEWHTAQLDTAASQNQN